MKRYQCTSSFPRMVEDKEGRWVLFDDVEIILEEMALEVEKLREYALELKTKNDIIIR